MMPLWVFTLGATIFDEADLAVPYTGLAEYTFALVVPLAIGLLIRRYSVKVANILVRILKPFAVFLIIFIVVFAIYTNLYLFELLSLEVSARKDFNSCSDVKIENHLSVYIIDAISFVNRFLQQDFYSQR